MPFVAVAWSDEFQGAATPPESIAESLQAASLLLGDVREVVTVIAVIGAEEPESDEESDRLCAEVWTQLEQWTDALIPHQTVRAVVRFGDPVAEVLEELREQTRVLLLVPQSGIVTSGAERLMASAPGAVWLRPVYRNLALSILSCDDVEARQDSLRVAVDAARTLHGRLLLGLSAPANEEPSARDARVGDLARTLAQFDYRTIPGGVKIEVAACEPAMLAETLRKTEPIDIVLETQDRATALKRALAGDSVWVAHP